MQNLFRILAQASDAPRSAPVTDTPSTVLRIGSLYWRVDGFGCVLTAIGFILASCGVCGLVAILAKMPALIF